LVVGIHQVVYIVGEMIEPLNWRCTCALEAEVRCAPYKESGLAVPVGRLSKGSSDACAMETRSDGSYQEFRRNLGLKRNSFLSCQSVKRPPIKYMSGSVDYQDYLVVVCGVVCPSVGARFVPFIGLDKSILLWVPGIDLP